MDVDHSVRALFAIFWLLPFEFIPFWSVSNLIDALGPLVRQHRRRWQTDAMVHLRDLGLCTLDRNDDEPGTFGLRLAPMARELVIREQVSLWRQLEEYALEQRHM